MSDEPTVLRLETLDAIESAITHDALHGETLDQHHAAQTAFLRSLLKKFDAGKFEPNPADGRRLSRFKRQERSIVEGLKQHMSQYIDMKGVHAERVRSYFEANEQQIFVQAIAQFKNRIMSEQSAAERATEADVPQRKDEMVEYLKKLGMVLELKRGQIEPKVLARQIMGAFKRAEIDQNIGVMRELATNMGVPESPVGESLKDASFWALELADVLTDKPDKSNEIRRNWFIQAGIPTHPATTRAERSPSPALTTPMWEQVDTTAHVDPGTNLLPPKAKKGYIPRSRERDFAEVERLRIDGERATIVHQLLVEDHKNSHGFLDEKAWLLTKGLHPDYFTNHMEYFYEGRVRQQALMKRMGTAVYSALSDKSKFAGLVDRKRNPHWAKMQRQVIGKYLDAVAEPWNEARNVFHTEFDRNRPMFPEDTREYEHISSRHRGNKELQRKNIYRALGKKAADLQKGWKGVRAHEESTLSGLVEDIGEREKAIANKYSRDRAKRHEHQDDEEQELADMLSRLETLAEINSQVRPIDRSAARHFLKHSALTFDDLRAKVAGVDGSKEFMNTLRIPDKSHAHEERKRGFLKSSALSTESAWKRTMQIPLMEYYLKTNGLTDFTNVEQHSMSDDTTHYGLHLRKFTSFDIEPPRVASKKKRVSDAADRIARRLKKPKSALEQVEENLDARARARREKNLRALKDIAASTQGVVDQIEKNKADRARPFEKAKPPDITVPDFTSILPSRARTRSQTRADLAKAAKSLPFEPEKGLRQG